MRDVIYIFKKSKDNIFLADKGEFPKLFYGFFEMKELLNTSYIDASKELEKLSYINKFLRYLKSKLGIVESFSYFSQKAINKMNKAKIVYATTDGLALTLANLKREKLLKAKLIVNVMGLFDNYTYIDKIEYLDYVDRIIVFTFPLATKLKELGYLNTYFIPYGTDTNFYKPQVCKSLHPKNSPFILGIGQDRKRDWDMFRQVANKMKHLEFRVITHDKLKREFSGYSNISFLGNVSFLRAREEMCKADALFVPTKENLRLSGQTTLLNALAMKKPVIMPYDENFKNYGLSKTFFYERDCSLEDIINLIEMVVKKRERVMESINFNYNLVINEYNQMKFARRLMNVFLI